jgi:hypothetical protein
MVLKDLKFVSLTLLYHLAKLNRAASLRLFFENIIRKEYVREYAFLV